MTYEEMIQQVEADIQRLQGEVLPILQQLANPDPPAATGPPSLECQLVRAALIPQRLVVAGETAVLERLEELEAQLCPV